ncbi:MULTISPECIES: molybdate ABC transporter substrate-binding protein [Microbacterium]|uniref:molybdate ABC transporter substrate-binding protein n=1 Tax=Microbacterium TaxID=33882 RepID=UPI000D65A877|nr:molybdate ABC transporter substrate-binding protein [Microbacterium sp. KCTC 39802]
MHRRPAPLRSAVVFASLVLLLAGCAPTGDQSPGTSATSAEAEPELAGDLTVYAAASLKVAFDELATRFEARHPSVHVIPVTYDGSSTLATQILEGAPADVFASADEKNMQKVVDGGLAADPQLFATNTLVLVVPAGNPGEVAGLDDLADPARTVVLCAVEVPCGAASATLLANAGVTGSVDSYEQNVTAVLTKVAAGEADAGLVYVTDAATTGDVEIVETEGADAVVNSYPIAALADTADRQIADAFVAFVLGADGREVLAARGFGAP